MKFFLRYFWLVFFFYFIFIHPAIIYYAGNGGGTQYPNLNYFYLSILIWIVVFIILGFILYKITFKSKNHVDHLIQQGQRLEGKILESSILKVTDKKEEKRELLVEMQNLKGETIQHLMDIIDTKPWESRFEEGNKVYFRVDSSFKLSPYIVLETIKTHFNYFLIILYGIFILGIIGYYFFVFQSEGNGISWNFFGPWHPILISGYCIIGFSTLFYLVFWKFIRGFSGKDYAQLKFNGRKTTARVVKVKETGTRINNQPLLLFEMEYADHLGRTYKSTVRKIVPLLDLANAQTGEKEIFYLEENPQKIAFVEDLLQTT